MESGHSVLPPVVRRLPHPPTYRRLSHKVYSTLGQILDILEQLKPSEDLRSQLQKLVVTEADDRATAPQGLGAHVELDPSTIIKVSRILGALDSPRDTSHGSGRSDMSSVQTHGTTFASSVDLARVSEETPGTSKVGGERVLKASSDGRNLSLSKQDSLYLMKKIRDFEQKCKPLQEKNKKFLERNMELTMQNRNLKEQIRNIVGENKTLKEHLNICRQKCSGLSRQLNDAEVERARLEKHAQEVDRLKTDNEEQAKTITAMKQLAVEKDRRMEVLQHRKKRRLRLSPEYLSRLGSPSSADDERSQDSDLSVTSVSQSCLSDDDIIEELPPDDNERLDKKFRTLQKEHLLLQKSTAKLQGILGWGVDPQRYVKTKLDFEADLYVSRCKIDSLEECLEKYKDNDASWTTEKEQLSAKIRTHQQTIDQLELQLRETTGAYEELKEHSEQLEFLVLETQENTKNDIETDDASTNTDSGYYGEESTGQQQRSADTTKDIEEIVQDQHQQTDLYIEDNMATEKTDRYHSIVNDLETKLTNLLRGQGSEVKDVIQQLRKAERQLHSTNDMDKVVQGLRGQIGSLQQENARLTDRLTRCRDRLDTQELALTRDEREELMAVKPSKGESDISNRLRLAEVGHHQVRDRSLERTESWERLCSSPLLPTSHAGNHNGNLARLKPASVGRTGDQAPIRSRTVSTESDKSFHSQELVTDYVTPVTVAETETNAGRHLRTNSLPSVQAQALTDKGMSSEVEMLRRQTQDLKDENDVLRFELMQQRGHTDSDGSDGEESRVSELRETCEHLRERIQTAEGGERQVRDRLKLAEKHIMELELNETVLRDRVEEGNADCDKLRKQIVRLQRKIRESKDVISDRETAEMGLVAKLKYMEEAEAELSLKVTELERTNHILQQRLDVQEENQSDLQLLEDLTNQLEALKTVNSSLESRVMDLEENNDMLKENWRKVADEEADRRECLEDKIRVLESVNNEMKSKLKEYERELELGSGPSIATEINADTIEKLSNRISELEQELKRVNEGYLGSVETLMTELEESKKNEASLSEAVKELEVNEQELQDKIAELESVVSRENKLNPMCASQESLVDQLSVTGKSEIELREELAEMQKGYEKKITMFKREIAELHQQEDDLCTRIEELEENEISLNNKLSKLKETEMNYKNKIEELENRETSLTIRFSQRIEEMEQNEKNTSERFKLQIEELKQNEKELQDKVTDLEAENQDLSQRVLILEKYEEELSEKHKCVEGVEQELITLVKSNPVVNGANSVFLKESYQTDTKLECEATVCAKLDYQIATEDFSLLSENQKLKETVMKLTSSLQNYEKEKKSLEEKLKRNDKKRKRSERADNRTDYDVIAREVVTYKVEVEQLRSENTDLHERIMELDESERSLQEKNEHLSKEVESLQQSYRHECELSSSREQELVHRINELESFEHKLKGELHQNNEDQNGIQNVCEDLGICSKRQTELVDKNVGTQDFMEGVGQEQGKPVSSMFERIQKLESENQELSTKLAEMTATDSQVRKLSEKVKGLEENEDSLMERVMELEEEEDRLKRELSRVRSSVSDVSDLEEKLTELHSKEDELNSTIESLKLENDSLKMGVASSDSEKGGIAVRLASVQQMYEEQKKKVESLLKSEEQLMKSVSSEKKAAKAMEEELAATQEKLEELQTEYEHKLADKDENEKMIKDELNKMCRENQVLQKKLIEFEKSNSELEDEIEHCKISESRMFHRLQQLNTQNEELELKLSKLIKLIPNAVGDASENLTEKKVSNDPMSENPEVVSENPLTTSIFTETELDYLRSKTPDFDLLGSVPLDMLKKMKNFDQREQNYQIKIKEMENKNIKLVRKMNVLQSKEKDLKHEIKELQLELMKFHAKKSLRATFSLNDVERSGSEDGIDSDNQSGDDKEDDTDWFKADAVVVDNEYDSMSQEELLLSVKLMNEKQNQDTKKQAELEGLLNRVRDLMKRLAGAVECESLDDFVHTLENIQADANKLESEDLGVQTVFTSMLEAVTRLRQRLEALQDSEQALRLSLAESEVAIETLSAASAEKVHQLQAQIHVLAKISHRYQNCEQHDIGIQSSVGLHNLEPSKTINIDVPPSARLHSLHLLQSLGQSETIHVNVPPTHGSLESEDSDTGYFGYPESSAGSAAMMDRAEDVLRQRIRELEKLEKHLKQQVSDLECDRDELHQIARKDKNTIHEQNVVIRQLQLSQRNLQEQVTNFEKSENSLYARLDEMEGELDVKDDRIRDLEILEERLKDLVKQYKLDEKILQTKSRTLESSVREMSEKEQTLKQKVKNLETEKSAFCERSEYLQLRLKELESAETDLAQRSKNQENIMQTLQSTVIELETFGANAHARVVELEHVNFDLQQRLHHAMVENSPLSKQLHAVQGRHEDMASELQVLREAEVRLRRENEALQSSEIALHAEQKTLRLQKVDLEARVRSLEEADSVHRDRLSRLQRSENTLKYRLQELETSSIKTLDGSQMGSGSMKLPRTLEECQRRIIVLQTTLAELQSRLQTQNKDFSGNSPEEPDGFPGHVSMTQAEYQILQQRASVEVETRNQLEQADRLNSHLQGTIAQLRQGKDVCGHEVEIEVLRKRLHEANMSIKMLQNQPKGQWVTQGPEGQQPGSGGSPGEEVQETISRTSAGSVQMTRPPGQKLSRDHMMADLTRSAQAARGQTATEDEHWHEIEARMEAADRGGERWVRVGKATSLYAAEPDTSGRRYRDRSHGNHGNDEVLEVAVALQSETEYSQNDTDSCRRAISPWIHQRHNNGVLSSRGARNSTAPPLPHNGSLTHRESHRLTDDSFVDNVQDCFEESRDQTKEMLYRKLDSSHVHGMSAPSFAESVADSGRGTNSVSMATSACTLRERLQHIEKQLSTRESDSAREIASEFDLTTWKSQVHESNRRLELAEKDNKQAKDEINRLEKELEEKTRLYQQLEAFLRRVQEIVALKNTISDNEIVTRLEKEVARLVSSVPLLGECPTDGVPDLAALSAELAKKDRELSAKRNETDSLLQELRQWQLECRTIEEMRTAALDSLRGLELELSDLQLADRQLKDIKEEYNTLKGQAADKQRSASPATTHTRLVQLTNLCNDKDMLIKKLVQELKKFKSGTQASNLVEELSRLESDHNHNLLARSISQSSLDSLERMSVVSDTELLRGTSPSLAHRPHSADIQPHRGAPHRASFHGHSNLPRHHPGRHSTTPIHRLSSKHGHLRSSTTHSPSPHPPGGRRSSLTSYLNGGDHEHKTTQYVAIADYDPAVFSQSGHPRLELPLAEGDIVLVTGPLHDSGYVEGEVRGRVGLVPLSYLQPSSPHRRGRNQHPIPAHLNASPERIAQMYNSLHGLYTTMPHGHHAGIPGGVTDLPGNRHTVATVKQPPDTPGNFHVEKIIGHNGLMLAWQPVALNNNGCNNGVRVTGYKVFKDNKLALQPRGRHASKAIIENVGLQSQHRFGIVTVAVDGSVSALSEILYEGVDEVTSDENSDTESEMDLTNTLNVDEYKSGQKRTFIGVYDYDPAKNSPYEHPSCELAFSAGDVITVYGRQRGDGFYYAEINGVRGLVPTFFIEEMPQPPPRTKKIAARNKHSLKEKSDKPDN
ncbi:centromere protein F-like isoform X3 [Dreissena polymorpha]|uniref:centromere protein F-like isoform X3 n=1 Tax=Dreissena polymorpha TaxID=45954 RepID=UPI002263AE86|nr:centromere protein F-like isoform X3 [Dreissena polymorpha]